MCHEEVSALMIPLLQRCSRHERQYIAGLAMAAALETYSPGDRERALEEAVQVFRSRLEG